MKSDLNFIDKIIDNKKSILNLLACIDEGQLVYTDNQHTIMEVINIIEKLSDMENEIYNSLNCFYTQTYININNQQFDLSDEGLPF